MICGTKWKGCNCPWFNHEQIRAHEDGVPAYRIVRDGPVPLDYREELQRRQRREAEDADLARHLHSIDLQGIEADLRRDQDPYQNYAGILTGVFNQAAATIEGVVGRGGRQPIVAPTRDVPHLVADLNQLANGDLGRRASMRVVPLRANPVDVRAMAHDIAVDPATVRIVRGARERPRAHPRETQRQTDTGGREGEGTGVWINEQQQRSRLAGITRDHRTRGGRVGAWLRYVEDGPPDGESIGT